MTRCLSLLALVTLVSAPAVLAAPPVLDASVASSNNNLNVHWQSTPGQLQQIQVSSNLITWSNLPPILASVFSDSTWSDDGSFTGNPAASPHRYYRLVQSPAFTQAVGVPITLLPAHPGLSYFWNFGDGTTSTSNNPSHIFPADGVYNISLVVTDATGSHTNSGSIQVEIPSQVLLTPSLLAALRLKATNNTPQWQSFKSRLDGQLNTVIGSGAYQGDELAWIGDYALGYKVLEFKDPVTAAKYADKALGLMKSALVDFQKFGEISQQFLARGDGVTKTFTLPDSNIIASSLAVYTAPISNYTVVRGTNSKSDSVDDYLTFIKVSNTSDGTADYREGIDWQHTGELPNDQIDWSIAAPGHLPAAGSTYYVTTASSLNIDDASVSLSGNSITLSNAPGIDKAIYVQYVYGVHATNYSTLAFQQTHAGDGGFNSVRIDTGYSYRYLGKFPAMGYDWLYGYPGFTASFKNQLATMLVRWSDDFKVTGYRADDPASNYAEGGYISRMLTALTLGGGRNTNSPRLINEMIAYRQSRVLPVITNTTTSYYGGFWAEGWNYGPQAARNLILSGFAYETAGLGNANPERQWAAQVINSLINEQPSQNLIYDGGDWYDYPTPFVEKDLLYLMAAATTDATARSNANYMIQNYSGSQLKDMQDLIYRDPNAGAAFWSSTAPLQYLAQGTGLITARADWTYNSTWLAFQLGNLIETDHQAYDQGQLEIQRGVDGLLINANEVGENQNPNNESSFGNLVAVDDNGAGTQNYRFSQGSWFGNPGCRITLFEATNNYVYASGDYAAAYSLNTTPGVGTATRLTRQVVYQRPDFIFVHDRATTKAANDAKELRWHFRKTPAVNAGSNSWVATNGASKLFGQTFSRAALTTTNGPVHCPPGSSTIVYRVATQNSANATNVTYVTALQSAPAATSNMVSTISFLSSDNRMEGIQMGTNLVLFGADTILNPFTGTISYIVTGASPVVHLLTDLQPNRSYQITTNGSAFATLNASSQGTLTFTNTPSGAQTITIQ